jgi:hypothetical protein
LIFGFGLSYAGFYLDLDSLVLDFLAKNFLVLVFLSLVVFMEKAQILSLLNRKKSS